MKSVLIKKSVVGVKSFPMNKNLLSCRFKTRSLKKAVGYSKHKSWEEFIGFRVFAFDEGRRAAEEHENFDEVFNQPQISGNPAPIIITLRSDRQ